MKRKKISLYVIETIKHACNTRRKDKDGKKIDVNRGA
jgi:hypothetical protein